MKFAASVSTTIHSLCREKNILGVGTRTPRPLRAPLHCRVYRGSCYATAQA